MITKTPLAKVASPLLLLAMSLVSTSVLALSSDYEHTGTNQQASGLWGGLSAWVGEWLPEVDASRPGFRWIETTQVQQDARQAGKPPALNVYAGLIPYQRVVAPGGMFRRFEHGPAASFNGGQAHSPDKPYLPTDQNLSLQANIPDDLFVPDSEIVWLIRPLQGGVERELFGRNLHLSLPDGVYEVLLRIGAYEERARVEVDRGRMATPYFATNIGRLRVSSTAPANWDVFLMQGATPTHRVLGRTDSQQINRIVPAGEFEVVATINDASQRVRIRVGRGATSDASLSVPTGRINLVATLGNVPAMRPMQWRLFRLDGGRREVASPTRHSATLVVAPGHYEAIASLNGRERRREFTVRQGSDNSVVLAMD